MTLQRMCVESNGDFTDPQVPLRQYAVLCVGRASSVMTTSAIGTTGLCWGQSAGQHGLSESGIPSTSQYPSSTICSSSSSSRTQATYRVSTPVSPHVDEHWTDNNHILVTGRSTSCHMGVHTAEPRTENRAWHTDIHTYIHTYIRTHELISANSTCSICCGLVLELAEQKSTTNRTRGVGALAPTCPSMTACIGDERDAVTFPATRRHRLLSGTKLYSLVTGWKQLAQSIHAAGSRTRDLCITCPTRQHVTHLTLPAS